MNGFQKSIVRSAIEQDNKLSVWEVDFIYDMDNKADDYELSEKQNHIINRIAQKLD